MNDPTNVPQPRILIVEDSGMNRILLRTFLAHVIHEGS